MPREVRQVAERLYARRDHLGVFWGARRRGEDLGLILHTLDKVGDLPVQAIPKGLSPHAWAVPISVLRVPGARLHAIDTSHPVRMTDDSARGRSTITAIALVDGAPHLLLCAHGTFPLIDDALPSIYDPAQPVTVSVVDDAGVEVHGTLTQGRLDSIRDYAIARLEGDPDTVFKFHHGAERFVPIQVREGGPALHEEVRHFSAIRREAFLGTVEQISYKRIFVPGVGGHLYPYRNVLVVSTGDPAHPFSEGGDSGSLVVDSEHRAVGVVIGGDPAQDISYVLRLDALLSTLDSDSRPFFTKESE